MAIEQDKRLLKLPPSTMLSNMSGEQYFPNGRADFVANIGTSINTLAPDQFAKRLQKYDITHMPVVLWYHDLLVRCRWTTPPTTDLSWRYRLPKFPFGQSKSLMRSPKAVIILDNVFAPVGVDYLSVFNGQYDTDFINRLYENNVYVGIVPDYDDNAALSGLPWSGYKKHTIPVLTGSNTADLYTKTIDPTMFIGGEILFIKLLHAGIVGSTNSIDLGQAVQNMSWVSPTNPQPTANTGWQAVGNDFQTPTGFPPGIETLHSQWFMNGTVFLEGLDILSAAIPKFKRVKWILSAYYTNQTTDDTVNHAQKYAYAWAKERLPANVTLNDYEFVAGLTYIDRYPAQFKTDVLSFFDI